MQTKESPLFESAYFVLRRSRIHASSADMMAEAGRLIGEGNEYLARRRHLPRWGLFVGGFLVGSAIFALLGIFLF